VKVFVSIVEADHEAPMLVGIVRPHWRVVPSFRKAQDANHLIKFIAQHRTQWPGETVDHTKRLAELHHPFVRRKPFQSKLHEGIGGFSGHGLNDPRSGEYLFFPYEADIDARLKTLLPGSDVNGALATIPGKVLVFLDTCHSGNLLGTAKVRDAQDLTRLLNELTSAENGVVVFSASTGRQQAIESSDWKNGAFTLALLEALDRDYLPR
jgi:hypothetical protein